MKPEQEIKSKVTKKEISECFAELRKLSASVKNFNSYYKRINLKIDGITDFEIIHQSIMVKAEVKLYDDTLKQNQIDYGLAVIGMMSENVYYVLIDENNYTDIRDAIGGLKLGRLTHYEILAQHYLTCEQTRLLSKLKRSKK